MILSDGTIKDYLQSWIIKIETGDELPLSDIIDNVVCSSFDLRLGNEFKVFVQRPDIVLNPFTDDSTSLTEHITIGDNEDFVIFPWMFILGATKERIWLPDNLVARVEWRSSIWRLWLLVHITAWYIDPWFGWDYPSTITLEIRNINSIPIVVRPWMRICQLAFETMDKPAVTPYNKKKNAKYNGQIAPQESRFHISN
jgi:dCTP deaminase